VYKINRMSYRVSKPSFAIVNPFGKSMLLRFPPRLEKYKITATSKIISTTYEMIIFTFTTLIVWLHLY